MNGERALKGAARGKNVEVCDACGCAVVDPTGVSERGNRRGR
jgi:hypothetical protein